MKKLIFLPVFLVVILCASCSNDEGGGDIDSSIVGRWSGTYSGDDRGIWTVTVSSSGSVSGTATSSFTQDSAPINGRVTNNGQLSATLGNSEDREFVGQLEENNEAMGTWIDTRRGQDGTWFGTKN